MATQTVEEGGTQFQLPGGMLMAEDASVQEHMASHSLAVEQAAAASNTRSDEASDKRTGVPEELLKKLPVMTFGDAVSRDHKELLPKASDSKDTIKPALESTTQDDCPCCESRAPRIPGLQIDSEEDDRTCEICQSCYEWDEEVRTCDSWA